jgi:N-acetylmuramoyl-L-alanine amidase
MGDLPQSVDTLARTLWGEARGCGSAGMSHVANVIVNRADSPRWWGDDIISVCRAPEQFSCWNAGDPNHAKLLAVTTTDVDFTIAVSLAYTAVGRKLMDATSGADSYYAASMATPPYWAPRATETFSDGFHIFMRTELPAPDGGPDTQNVSVHTPVTPPPDEADTLDNDYNPEVHS